MRSARVKGGKFPEAIAWAKEIAALVVKKPGFPKIAVYVDVFGEVGTVRWMVDYDNLAHLEKMPALLREDTEYFAMLKRIPELFIEGSSHDIVMRLA